MVISPLFLETDVFTDFLDWVRSRVSIPFLHSIMTTRLATNKNDHSLNVYRYKCLKPNIQNIPKRWYTIHSFFLFLIFLNEHSNVQMIGAQNYS